MGFFAQLFGKKQPADERQAASPTAVAFAPGDRVRDQWGTTGVVMSVDPAAEHGLGKLVVKMDDGLEKSVSVVASGFEPVANGG